MIKKNNRPFLTGGAIKCIGLGLMVMDHLHQMFMAQGAPDWLGWFGRPVAAMFLFLCAEAFYHTRSKKRYMLQLLAGFIFMTALNMILSRLMPLETVVLTNNIFGTLFMAAYYMWMIDTLRRGIREKKVRPILLAAGGMILPFVAGLAMLAAIGSENRIAVILLLFLPNPITVEGGFILVLMGVLFYLLRNWRLVQAALILVIGALIWFVSKNPQGLMAAAIIPILLYNGQRGRGNKYFFYIFYPAHIYLFYTIAWLIR